MRIFIGCSSRDDIAETYKIMARELSHRLSSYEVVIGGSFVGLMKLVTEQVPRQQITQVYLKDYLGELENDSSQFLVCDTSFERVQQIWNLSDCFLLLPGGTGTLSELFSFLEENRTKENKKKIYLFNMNGFYDTVFVFLQKLISQNFCDETILGDICVVKTIDEFIKLLEKEV